MNSLLPVILNLVESFLMQRPTIFSTDSIALCFTIRSSMCEKLTFVKVE